MKGVDMEITRSVNTLMQLSRLLKSLIDRLIAASALLIISPVMLGLAIAIYLRMGSPIVFTQPRPGKDGRVFTFYKFRTMITDVREFSTNDPNFTASLPPDVQRITPLGHFLRNTSLDELPQLWNVVKGDMSFVGPRPLRVAYLPRYTSEQARRHHVKPGITGLAQINGRNAINWEERFKFDVWYVDHWSLWLDLQILFLTFFKVLRQEGVNEQSAFTSEEFRGQLDKQ
jgi:lipopolysaccharide/colanic/teichoic acid biosynthesis glycosyltransferase